MAAASRLSCTCAWAAGSDAAGAALRMNASGIDAPSAWVVRWAPLITHGTVLDVACGRGRHAKYFLGRNLKVVAVDREPQVIPGARFVRADLEGGKPWPFAGERFEGI